MFSYALKNRTSGENMKMAQKLFMFTNKRKEESVGAGGKLQSQTRL